MKLLLYTLIYALCMAGANLLLKFASQTQGLRWWIFFALANATGFGCVVILPYALKLAPSNIVYALAVGSGFCLLQISAALFFREPLSLWQWIGVVGMAVSLILLQIRPS